MWVILQQILSSSPQTKPSGTSLTANGAKGRKNPTTSSAENPSNHQPAHVRMEKFENVQCNHWLFSITGLKPPSWGINSKLCCWSKTLSAFLTHTFRIYTFPWLHKHTNIHQTLVQEWAGIAALGISTSSTVCSSLLHFRCLQVGLGIKDARTQTLRQLHPPTATIFLTLNSGNVFYFHTQLHMYNACSALCLSTHLDPTVNLVPNFSGSVSHWVELTQNFKRVRKCHLSEQAGESVSK